MEKNEQRVVGTYSSTVHLTSRMPLGNIAGRPAVLSGSHPAPLPPEMKVSIENAHPLRLIFTLRFPSPRSIEGTNQGTY